MAGSHECETENLDPGVPVRRRIAFRSTNLIGPFQDDAKIFSEKEKAGPSELGMTSFALRSRFGALHVGN
jgi:hypothetical protein